LGIDIDRITPGSGSHYRMPCNDAEKPGIVKCSCGDRSLFTPAEIAAQDEKREQDFAVVARILNATAPMIVEIKGRYRNQSRTSFVTRAFGIETCPVCAGKIRWSLDTVRMHIAMQCETKDCVSFLE